MDTNKTLKKCLNVINILKNDKQICYICVISNKERFLEDSDSDWLQIRVQDQLKGSCSDISPTKTDKN